MNTVRSFASKSLSVTALSLFAAAGVYAAAPVTAPNAPIKTASVSKAAHKQAQADCRTQGLKGKAFSKCVQEKLQVKQGA